MKNKENINLNVFYSAANLFQTFRYELSSVVAACFQLLRVFCWNMTRKIHFSRMYRKSFVSKSKGGKFCFQLFGVVYRYGFVYCASHKLTSFQPCAWIVTSGVSSSNRCLFRGEQFYLDFVLSIFRAT